MLKPTLQLGSGYFQGFGSVSRDYSDFGDVDMVIEAVPEIMELKKEAIPRCLCMIRMYTYAFT